MKVKKSLLVSYVLLIIFCSGIYFSKSNSNSNFSKEMEGFTTKDNIIEERIVPHLSSLSNNEIIESIFNSKVDAYNNFSYYPQIYESSLQATYYALYILNALGKLDIINQTAMINYIVSHYEPSSNRFMDSLSYRYLNTDFSRDWVYPFSSTLETTCHAILSLNLLNSLDLIDTQGIIEYLWNCYNTDTSGFIGQPYQSSLPAIFKTSTMDNTFYAVITLDLLMDDWLVYQDQKDEIIQFINDLQIPGGASWQTGGFFNDEDTGFDSLNPLFEPNLLSSFYCIKTLEVFGMEHTINEPNFHQFLNNSYDSLLDYFHIGPWEYPEDICNIVATALGLELSDITGFVDINRAETIDFILSNRNSLGNWDQSTTISHHELIDTFQIIRSLENSQLISQLTLEEKNKIGNATQLYYQTSGYSLLSRDYTSMNLMNTITGSFKLYGKLGDINIQELYAQINSSFVENYQETFTNSFIGYLQKSCIFQSFRSYPIEYYSNNNMLRSHKTTYFALDSLSRMFKLDDFILEIDGNELISDIVATQFLNDSYYDTYGAFTPLWPYNSYYESSFLNSKIFFEYSYYAIRCLELLSAELNLGNLSSLGVDTLALYNHIDRNIIETSTELHFDPSYTSNIETILEYTYYMIYLLKALGMYEKNSQKIVNFIEANLNYENIKNVYFIYKILEILDLEIELDTNLTQSLVQDIFSNQYYEFYCSTSREKIEHENFYWICEMARNSEIKIKATFSSLIELGTINHFEVSLDNLILHDFGTYLTFKFESDQLGTHPFSMLPSGIYIADILVAFDSPNYPLIEGILRAYEASKVKIEQYICFNTTYFLEYNYLIQKVSNIVKLSLNSSIICNNTRYSLESGSAFTEIGINDNITETKPLSHYNFVEYSIFNLSYEISNETNYSFNIYLNDGIANETRNVGGKIFNITDPDPDDPDPDDPDPDDPDPDDPDPSDPDPDEPNPDDDPNDISNKTFKEEIEIAVPLMITFVAAPGFLIIVSSKQLKKSKKNNGI